MTRPAGDRSEADCSAGFPVPDNAPLSWVKWGAQKEVSRRMDFDKAYNLYRHEILTLSQRAFLGMDPDDIAAEMTVALWRATQTFDAGKTDTPFGVYWWSVWKNRRSDLAAMHYAEKRVHAEPVTPLSDDLDGPYEALEWPAPPPGTTGVGKVLWTLLALGSTARESMTLAEITKRTYYTQIAAWRTEDVRDWLRRE